MAKSASRTAPTPPTKNVRLLDQLLLRDAHGGQCRQHETDGRHELTSHRGGMDGRLCPVPDLPAPTGFLP